MVEKIDWIRIVLDLRMKGMSTRKVSFSLGIPHSSIQSLMHGHEPRHCTGKALLELHAKMHEKDDSIAATS